MEYSLLSAIRTSKGFSRTVTYLIIVCLLGVVLERSIYYALRKIDAIPPEDVVARLDQIAPHKARLLALAQKASYKANQETARSSNEATLSRAVIDVQDTLDVMAYALINKQDAKTAQEKLPGLIDKLKQYDRQAMADFANTGALIERHQLAPTIVQRHEEMVDNYRSEMDSLLERLQEIQVADDSEDKLATVLAARKQLEEKQLKRSQQPFDPNDLNPVFSANPQNTPRIKKEDFTRAGLFDNPYPKLAALGDFKYDTLVGANDPTYLAETAEITLSQAIKDKAAALDYDPVQIYQWVRNNVEWLPTWGAYQSADLTLSNQRGNAMDIASLTIALLRASGVPSRYVHGSIEVPADKFTNWAGDFANVEAAQNYASVGGIPTTSIISGGKISAIRLEHIWIEAAIDYFPSRGAVNRDADSWVQMDPSYKQYEYTQGLDVASIASFDGQTLADAIIASGTVNEAEGWVQNLDPSVIQNAQTQVEEALKDHIATMPDQTVGNVLGGRRTIIREYPVLPSSLPNPIAVIGVRYGELPDGLRIQMSFALGADYFGNPESPITIPMASLNSQRITLSFKPATTADEEALLALLPSDTSQLPTSIPAYLIQVTPELKLNGAVIKSAASMRLGEELNFTYQFRRPIEIQAPYTYKVIAGSYLAIVAMGQEVSKAKLGEVRNRLGNVSTIIENQDQTQFDALTNEDILGDMFYAGVLGYYAEYNGISHIVSQQQRVNHVLAVGYGSFGYEPSVNYFFGVPRTLEAGGVVFNLRGGDYVGANTIDKSTDALFRQEIGMLASTLEHAIPEQMFVTMDNPGEAISAVKALTKASEQGQRIYHITQANIAATLQNIHYDTDSIVEIRNAVMAGKEVTAHTDPISIPGWKGVGYIIMEPETGIGAYKIAGGMNGGWLFWGTILTIAILFALSVLSLNVAGIIFGLLAYKSFLDRVEKISNSNLTSEQMYAELNKAAALSVIGALGGKALSMLGEIGAILVWYLRGIFIAFGMTWYG